MEQARAVKPPAMLVMHAGYQLNRNLQTGAILYDEPHNPENLIDVMAQRRAQKHPVKRGRDRSRDENSTGMSKNQLKARNARDASGKLEVTVPANHGGVQRRLHWTAPS